MPGLNRMVHETDIVEMELKSKKFSLNVRKKEAIEPPEPIYVCPITPAASQLWTVIKHFLVLPPFCWWQSSQHTWSHLSSVPPDINCGSVLSELGNGFDE